MNETVFESQVFLSKLKALMASDKGINNKMNCSFSDDFNSNLEEFFIFFKQIHKQMILISRIYNSKIVKLFEIMSNNSQKYLNVIYLVVEKDYSGWFKLFWSNVNSEEILREWWLIISIWEKWKRFKRFWRIPNETCSKQSKWTRNKWKRR